MNKYPTLKNAPITEAVFEIGAQLQNNFEIKVFKEFHDQIKDRYPESKKIQYLRTGLDFRDKDKPVPLAPIGGTAGFLFQSIIEKKVAQAKLDGFAFNKLKPYENWEAFYKEGRNLWELYFRIAKPIKIKRISLRYINRIEAPLPIKDFSEFILTNPQIAPGLPQAVSHFFMKLELQNEAIPAIASIIVTMDKQTKPNKLPLILDIDVSRNNDYENMAEMWSDFEKLRNLKNEIFFKSLTEKAKELFI
jgi:uncharacterized protein (TIGR04255 family)